MVNPEPLLLASPGDGGRKRLPLFPEARCLTSAFAIVSAFLFIFVAATILYADTSTCDVPSCPQPASPSPPPAASSAPKCYELPDAAGPVLRGVMWRGPAQAALALALLLAGERRTGLGMALALATVAVTVANHVLFARLAVMVYVATSADTIGTVWAVVYAAYFVLAAAVLLGLVGVLAFLLMGGQRAE